jgi:hypothetical protein
MERPNCMNCKHFYVTWDQSNPRGCRKYGIKTKQVPSVIVAQSTAEKTCLGYEAKKKKSDEKPAYY